MRTLIASSRRIYRKLPARPLRSQLAYLYYKYLQFTNSKVVAEVDGINFELDLRELIDSTIYFEGGWEPETAAALAAYATPGSVAFDVGANMGYFSLILSRLVGPSGTVVAFEPMSSAFLRLSRNLELNPTAHVIAENVALSDFDGHSTVSFTTSWHLDLSPTESSPEEVKFTSIDAYVKQSSLNLLQVNLIKLDVDGNEDAVLKGATDLLTQQGPIVILEVGRGTEGSLRLLAGLGYRFSSVGNPEVCFKLDALDSLLPRDDGKTLNVLARRVP